MALISLRQLLDHAAENDYGVPAFNVNNLEQMRAIMEGAQETQSPVIVQASAGARKYAGANSLESGTAGEEDGVGAEGILTLEQMLTDPEQAADFVAKTGVDALAIAIGTSHGAYKFSRPPTGDILAIERIKAIHKRLPNTHLVMHGSSSVPQELLAEINEFGGEIPETYGVPVAEIQQGIRHGVRKINIDTDLRLASTAAIRKHLANNPSEFDPRKYFADSQVAMKKVVIDRYEAFGTSGQAVKLRAHSLEKMFSLYAAGDLEQVVK
jgi:fructose-bisphosphate aldolase class II